MLGYSPHNISVNDIKKMIQRCNKKDNFWMMGPTGPCGPSSEIFYDHGDHIWGGPPGSTDEDGDRFVEIWNLVFMQYEQFEGGSRKPLGAKSIDTGMGIEKEDLTHVFERFYQSQSTDKQHIAGSGIGLAFTKKLTEMHYGYISAESEVDKGTTITIQLPIVKKQIEEDEIIDETIELPLEKEVKIDEDFIQKEISSNIKVSGNFSDKIIFYAEDNLEMRNYVSNILSKYFNITIQFII